MFEKELADKVKRIFDLDKVTYRQPSESQEQECLFIHIITSKNHIKDKRFIGKATGKINVFSEVEKLPYGYFSKCIDNAKIEDISGLFFYDFEENVGTIDNICERSMSFIYLFDIEFDPNIGLITSVATTVTVGT